MKILHLLQSNRFSGAENVACQIIDIMRAHPEYEIVYCSTDGPIREALQERNIRFAPIKKLSIKELRRVFAQEKPDVIHAHDRTAGFYAALTCGKTKLIAHIHNSAFASQGISLKSMLYLLAAWKAKHIFWVSSSACEGNRFHKLLKKKSTVLQNIINVDALYQRMALDENVYNYDVVYLGRLACVKNPQRMMRILAKVLKQRPETKIAIVGQGELEAEVKSLAKTLAVADKVAFLGFQSNPLKILHDAKAMLITSYREGFPMCMVESLAVGTPVVSTPIDGVKERVEDGKNGFLSDEDDVLAARIIEILTNAELYEQLSAYAKKQSAEVNNAEEYCRKLIDAYGK